MTALWVVLLLLAAGVAVYAWIGFLWLIGRAADQIVTRRRMRSYRKRGRMAQ